MGKRSSGSRLALASVVVLLHVGFANALITGGEGNRPLRDPGWPAGAVDVFNWDSRVAWWEGPPFGGGQWHAEAKGNAEEINKVLRAFARIDLPDKRVILQDGVGFSFWLDPNRAGKGKRINRDHKIDWIFTVWTDAGWQTQQKLPVDLRAAKGEKPECTLTIYTGTVRWDELKIPSELSVTDNTLEGHGFEKSDGRVLSGKVTSAKTGQPMKARIRVEWIDRKSGGYEYTPAVSIATGDDGTWHLKNFSTKWSRLIAEAPGYAPRVFHYAQYDRQPGFTQCNTKLVPSGTISGQVVDSHGEPIENPQLIIRSITTSALERYEILQNRFDADAAGKFSIAGLPAGSCRITAYKEGYQGGLGAEVKVPQSDCRVELSRAGGVRVRVEFPDENSRATNYIVNIAPVGGEKVGSWGGSSQIGDDNSVEFKNVPPGEYEVYGRPNPGSAKQTTEKTKVVVKASETAELKLQAK